MLVRGLEADVAISAGIGTPNSAKSMADLMRNLLVFAVPPVVVLLMWSGARDHITQKYGSAPDLFALDWVAIISLAVVIGAAIVVRVQFYDLQEHHSKLVSVLAYSSAMIAIASTMGSTLLITFSAATDAVSDWIPGVAIATGGYIRSAVPLLCWPLQGKLAGVATPFLFHR